MKKKAKKKPLTPRAAAKRIKELEMQVEQLKLEKRDARATIMAALGLDKYIDDCVGEITSRLEDLESRFW